MDFEKSFKIHNKFLMEGALGERLKREYHLTLDENLALAKLVLLPEGRAALKELWEQYIDGDLAKIIECIRIGGR